jgi:hypothetical protein
MSMTRSELVAHADRLTGLLSAKRSQIEDATMGPVFRAHLLLQIDALSDRVNEIQYQCWAMRYGTDQTVVIREPELSVSRAAIQAAHTSPM